MRSTYQRPERFGGRFFRRTWEFCWKAGLTLLVPLILVMAWYGWQANEYDLTRVARMPERTVLIDRHGEEFGTVHGANRRLIKYEEIPEFLKQALFAREDSRFLKHQGVDFFGLARATLRNLKDRDFTQGASTLSMQLTRNSFNLLEKKSLHRKFLEIALTYRVEARFSKEEILTHYLNRIYFGSGCHGIEEAARNYFGRPTARLSKGQCALLVGIIRAPHACSPWRNEEAAIRQRDQVLDRLVIIGELTTEEAAELKAAPLDLQPPGAMPSSTSHGTRVLRRPLETVLNDAQITIGGLEVHTSLDFELQQALEALTATAPLPEGCQIAAVALDPQSGDVLGVVGCREERPTGFNRALDSRRGLGPEMVEPLIGTVALERGHLPLAGRPVATGRQLDDADAVQLLRRFGFAGNFGEGEDLYRGSLSASPLELAVAYATLQNEGARPAPVFIRRLVHHERTLIERKPSFFPAFAAHARLAEIPRFLSGSSLPQFDHWFATLTPQMIVVVWVGFDQPKRFTLPPATTRELRERVTALPG